MGKKEDWHLQLSQCKYFDKTFTALFNMFTRLGFPLETLTDMGSQFTSAVMREISRLLSIKMLTTTPYHPMCNGLVEKFNRTLKSMLRKVCTENPKDLDRFIPTLLFAYHETPQENLVFSPSNYYMVRQSEDQ